MNERSGKGEEKVEVKEGEKENWKKKRRSVL